MILKGADAYFKVPAVETCSSRGPAGGPSSGADVGRDPRGPAAPPAGSGGETVVGTALASLLGAMRGARHPVVLRVKRPAAAPGCGREDTGRRDGPDARPLRPILELVLCEEVEEESLEPAEVFRISYDAEIRFMIARGMISPNVVPTSFIRQAWEPREAGRRRRP